MKDMNFKENNINEAQKGINDEEENDKVQQTRVKRANFP